jgi:hypothetical protein
MRPMARFWAISGALWLGTVGLLAGSLATWHHTEAATAVCVRSGGSGCPRSTLIYPVSIAILLAIVVTAQLFGTLVFVGRRAWNGSRDASIILWAVATLVVLGLLQLWENDYTTQAPCVALEKVSPSGIILGCVGGFSSSQWRGALIGTLCAATSGQCLVVLMLRRRSRRLRGAEA